MSGLARMIAALSAASIAWLAATRVARAEETGPTLQKIAQAGAITLGYRENAAPFSYLDADKQPIGFTLDLCGLVAEKVRERLQLSGIRIDTTPITSGNRTSLLNAGEIDIDCTAVPKSAELARDAAISIPIYASQFRWLVPRQMRVERAEEGRTRAEVRTPSTVDDLLGKPVVLTQGSAAAGPILDLSVGRFLGLSILYAKDPAAAFKLVETGQAAAFIDDDVVLLGLKAKAKQPDSYGFLQDSFPSASYVLAMRKDDPQFKELADSALTEAMRSGEYAKLYAKWFESPIPPGDVNQNGEINLNYAMPERVKRLIKDPLTATN